ncbi:hypothetical protein LT85_0661 [Collimonas arenae]|uniref:Uncharacterized protein n=1 Tax=Collimonas arenae TaxID=279058 RepID=A0A0A1F5P2_9BURK|nr:hypothetical protein LT85_0661 [Collimonas arenae]
MLATACLETAHTPNDREVSALTALTSNIFLLYSYICLFY